MGCDQSETACSRAHFALAPTPTGRPPKVKLCAGRPECAREQTIFTLAAVSGAQHDLCVRRQHGTYRALSDGDFFSRAVRPPPGTKDHRILANNPFKPVIYSLATMLHSENVGHNQMDEFLRVIRHDGDRTPYSAEALRYMPQTAQDILYCVSQEQAAPAQGGSKALLPYRRDSSMAVPLLPAVAADEISKSVHFGHPAIPAVMACLHPDIVETWQTLWQQLDISWEACNVGRIQRQDVMWMQDEAALGALRGCGDLIKHQGTGQDMSVGGAGHNMMCQGELFLFSDVKSNTLTRKGEPDNIAPTEVCDATKAWWKKCFEDFKDGESSVLEPGNRATGKWWASLEDLIQRPGHFRTLVDVDASTFDGWVSQRVDWVDEEGNLVAVQEPFWFTHPYVSQHTRTNESVCNRECVNNAPIVTPPRGTPAPQVRLQPLWDACPSLTIPLVTGMDPLLFQAWRASVEEDLPLRLWQVATGQDAADRGKFSIKDGVSRLASYSWPLSIDVRVYIVW